MPQIPTSPPAGAIAADAVLVVGAGRLGTALVAALTDAGVDVRGPAGRGASGEDAAVVLLAVPDAAIAEAAALIAPGRLVGHLSGATTLAPLSPHAAFSIHPLITVTARTRSFTGVPAALAGSSAAALRTAQTLAAALGMAPFEVADADRTAYHAAASLASNLVVALESVAEALAGTAGVDRAALVPLARAAIDDWAVLGARAALTGPVVRGDEPTVQAQRAAVAERLPARLALFDELVSAARDLAGAAPPSDARSGEEPT
ncbi:Rossmann-like and DUF2520 domain-containing protein [Microbacterium sp. 18062]|uniref:Rossmann-like and DUF2520 domain-containing protein n=1 Tax=Microbacterium sp. 18062 TaxID=2681410 RepID=UPI00135B4F8D|nr:Rossmann-like and DUF2520 domain-containing protein [Microbacterium sp. 18062]